MDLFIAGVVTGGKHIESFWVMQICLHCMSDISFTGECVPYHTDEILTRADTEILKGRGPLREARRAVACPVGGEQSPETDSFWTVSNEFWAIYTVVLKSLPPQKVWQKKE